MNILGIMASICAVLGLAIALFDSKYKMSERTWGIIRKLMFMPINLTIAFYVLIMVLGVWSGIMFPWE